MKWGLTVSICGERTCLSPKLIENHMNVQSSVQQKKIINIEMKSKGPRVEPRGTK